MRIDHLSHPALTELLQSRYFMIPRFQRPYSWDRGNVEDFWIDAIEEGTPDYFIGSVVTYSKGDAYAIVDGQQRLTTATLLLCSLRNALHQEGLKDLAKGVHAYVERRDVENQPRFILDTETSKPYLQEYIQKYGPPELDPDMGSEERALDDAFTYLNGRIDDTVVLAKEKGGSKAQQARRIKKELTRARDNLLALRTIFIVVDDEDDAYIIFETLNTRGKELQVSDLVKNHLLRLLGQKTKSVDPPREKWNGIQLEFDQSRAGVSINAFIHHSWLSRYDFVAERKLFKAIKKKIRTAQASDYLDTLVAESRLYRQINEPSVRNWHKEERPVRDSLLALAQFRIRQPMPLVLSLMRSYDASDLKLAGLRRALWAIEAFHFGFTVIAGKSSSGGMSYMYARLARELLAAPSSQKRGDVIKEIQSSLRERRPTKAEFTEGFSALRESEDYTQDRPTVQYVLRRHYAHHAKSSMADLSLGTIEHLAAQATKSIDAESVAKIGNLILVSEDLNNRLGSKSFSAKRKILDEEQTEVWVPADVLAAKQWRLRDVDARTERLAAEAYDDIWAF